MALAQMVRLLAPMRLYRLEEGDLVLAELHAYDVGLRAVEEALSELAQEAFLPTAEKWGLERREQLFGTARNTWGVEERRERLLLSYRHIRGEWDREYVLATVGELAPGASLVEDVPAQCVRVSGLPRWERPEWYRPLWQALCRLLPAQLRLLFDTGKPDWNTADAYGLSFDELDYLEFAWDFLEEA